MGTRKQLNKLKLVIGSCRLKTCPVSGEWKDERQQKLCSCSVCAPLKELRRMLREGNALIHPILSTILLTVRTAGRSEEPQELFLSAVYCRTLTFCLCINMAKSVIFLENSFKKMLAMYPKTQHPKLSLSTLSARKLFGLHQGNSEPNSANVLNIYFAYFFCFLERSISLFSYCSLSKRRCCFICFLQKVGGVQGFKNGLIYWIY